MTDWQKHYKSPEKGHFSFIFIVYSNFIITIVNNVDSHTLFCLSCVYVCVCNLWSAGSLTSFVGATGKIFHHKRHYNFNMAITKMLIMKTEAKIALLKEQFFGVFVSVKCWTHFK